ncbi:uncharacterized protein LOC131616343 [Vicia villosa]|uniref:uncharacterized protein LOC131616343 n=1 Tax=Vicia villosa TaxID=3911 RepID=UPI00273CEEFA|nr:uncharacterized protein LOC131616343 [Vicia villosa]
MSLLSGKKRNREITLFMSSPSLPNSKIIQLATCDDKKIDFGSIGKAFGLDPSTLKLNGYFISRGIDFISSSLTWDSLLSFFSGKGLSTGKHDHDALLVTGKVGNNGGHETEHAGSNRGNQLENFQNGIISNRGNQVENFQNGIVKVIQTEHDGSNRGNQLEDINLHKNKKLRESKSGEILNVLNCKRKQLFEDVNQFKKLKINDIQDKVDELPGSISRSQFTCSYRNKNLKRIRDVEIVAANYKRIR